MIREDESAINARCQRYKDEAHLLTKERDDAVSKLEDALEVLREIRDTDWVDNCLDPQRPARLATEFLDEDQEPDTSGEQYAEPLDFTNEHQI